MPEVPLSQVRLHVEDHGPGTSAVPTAVLVHGWACDHSDWDEVLPYLREHLRLVTLDLRGHGRSSDGPGYSLPEMAADLTELLVLLDLRDVVLMGHSAGAEVAIATAAMDGANGAERVRAMVAVDPAYGFAAGDEGVVRQVVDAMADGDPRQVGAEYFRRLDTESGSSDELRARHRAAALRSRPRAAASMFDSFAFGPGSIHFRPETDRAHAPRRVPLLAVYRNSDRGQVGREFAVQPADRVEVYDGTGHWPHQERPDRFSADVLQWLVDIGIVDIGIVDNGIVDNGIVDFGATR